MPVRHRPALTRRRRRTEARKPFRPRWRALIDSRLRKTVMSTWWSAFCSAKWKLPATLFTSMYPSRWHPSPTCLRSSAIASLSSKTPGSSSESSRLSSKSPPANWPPLILPKRCACRRNAPPPPPPPPPPTGSSSSTLPPSRRRALGLPPRSRPPLPRAAGGGSSAIRRPSASSRTLLIFCMTFAAWLPETSSVSRLRTASATREPGTVAVGQQLHWAGDVKRGCPRT